MSTTHKRSSLTDGIPEKKPAAAAESGTSPNKVRAIAMVGIFLVLVACVAWIYWPDKPAKSDYEPPPEPGAAPGAAPAAPTPPPTPPPPAPGVRPTITG